MLWKDVCWDNINTLSIYGDYAVIISINGNITTIMGILSNLYCAATICINHFQASPYIQSSCK